MRVRPVTIFVSALACIAAACTSTSTSPPTSGPSPSASSASPSRSRLAGGAARRRQGPAGPGGGARATGGHGRARRRPGPVRGGEGRTRRRDPRRVGSGRPVLDLTGQVSLGPRTGPARHRRSRRTAEFLYVEPHGHRAATRRSRSTRWATTAPIPATRREVLFVDQPFSNHNGGDARVRARRVPVHRRSATAGAAAIRTATASRSRRCSARCCGSRRRPSRRRAVQRSRPTTRSSARRRRAPGDLGLRPAEPVAVLVRPRDRRPVDRRRRARTRGRRSTCEPAGSPGGANYGWNRAGGHAPVSRATRRPGVGRRRSYEYPTRRRAARSPAATSTGARRSPAWSARTSSRTSAGGGSRRSACGTGT